MNSFFKKRTVFIFLFFIFLIGIFLRFYKLNTFPIGFHIDEASKGYSAYSLLKTGRDDNNNILPLYIDIFGDNSPAGYHYITIIPVAIFGLTEFAVRFSGALFGSFSILACYFLTYSIFQDRKTGLLAALFLAISPWHINLSRASSESIIALFFIMLGFSLIILSFQTQAIKHIVAGTSILSISFLFYQTPRLFVPLLFLVLIIFFFRIWKMQINSKYKKAFIYSFFFLSLFDFLLIFIVPGGTGRFNQVNIFSYPETKLVLEEQIREDGVNGTSIIVTRFFHNKVTNFFLAYVSNYLEYFSWNFLFMKGLPSVYFVPNMGVMYLVELPLVLFGLLSLALHKSRMHQILLIWLLLAPIAAATAIDINNLQRALVMFPILEIIAAYGLVYLFTNVIKQRALVFVVISIFLFIFNISYFLHQYFVQSKVHRPWYRNNGFSQMMELVSKDYNNYDRVITTRSGGGYPLFLFYSKYDPFKYQIERSPKDKNYSGFGKFIFTPDSCPFVSINPLIPKDGKIIFIEDGSCKENNNLHKVPFAYILRGDGAKAFRIVYVKDDSIFKTQQ